MKAVLAWTGAAIAGVIIWRVAYAASLAVGFAGFLIAMIAPVVALVVGVRRLGRDQSS